MRGRRVAVFLVGVLVAVTASEAGARFAVDAADAPILRWHDFSSQLKVEQMAALPDGADVVIVGTSMAQQDLVPTLIASQIGDSSVYNAGLNGGVPVMMEPWLMHQVLPALEPRLVVWGLSPLDMSAVYGDATKNAYDQAFETRQGLLATADRWVSKYSTLVSSRAVLRDPRSLFGDESIVLQTQAAEAAAALGVAGNRIVFDTELGIERQTEVSDRVSPFNLDRDDLAAIARTVVILRSSGVEVVFVELPIPPRFVSVMPNKGQDLLLFSEAVAALGSELDVVVLGASDLYDDSDFVDFTHMSSSAAANFSADIGAQLAGL